MKHIILVVGLLTFSSCAGTYIRQWDQNQVTACCPKQKLACNDNALKEAAQTKCGTPVTPMGGGTTDSGARITEGFGGGIQLNNTRDECVIFRCDRAPASK